MTYHSDYKDQKATQRSVKANSLFVMPLFFLFQKGSNKNKRLKCVDAKAKNCTKVCKKSKSISTALFLWFYHFSC